jgi:hypothetical protein
MRCAVTETRCAVTEAQRAVCVDSCKITDALKKMTVSRRTVINVTFAANVVRPLVNVASGKMTVAALPVSAAGDKLDNRLKKLDDCLIPATISPATTNVTH